MLVDNGRFIQLTNDHPYNTLNGQPLYINSQKICVIRPRFDVNGHAKGSYVYLDGNAKEDYALPVKESPEEIIGLINNGIFCAFSNKFPYGRLPYPGK